MSHKVSLFNHLGKWDDWGGCVATASLFSPRGLEIPLYRLSYPVFRALTIVWVTQTIISAVCLWKENISSGNRKCFVRNPADIPVP